MAEENPELFRPWDDAQSSKIDRSESPVLDDSETPVFDNLETPVIESSEPQVLDSEPSAFRPVEPRRSYSISSEGSSAFSPVELGRSYSVSSDVSSALSPGRSSSASSAESTSSLASPQHFVNDSSRNEYVVFADPTHINAVTSAYYPHHHVYSSELLNAHYTWLANYQQAVDRLNQQDAVAKQIKKSRPKKFQCTVCTAAFSNNGQLQGHLRIHTGERPHKCEWKGCGKAFTRNEELTRHKKIHTGIRPYLCQVCRKAFGRKDHLKKHSKTHEPRVGQPRYQFTPVAMAAVAAAYYNPAAVHPTAFTYPSV